MPAIIPRTVALADGVDILVDTFTADAPLLLMSCTPLTTTKITSTHLLW